MSANNETYQIAGHSFTLKGYTRPNEKALIEADERLQQQMSEGEIDRFEYYAGLLKVVLDGPVEHITPDVVEGRRAEDIVENFIPESMRLRARLLGL